MSTDPPSNGLSRRGRVLGLAVVLLLQGLLLWIYYEPAPKRLVGDEIGYLRTARALQSGEASRQDPVRAPLYPHLLALLRVDADSRLPIQILQIVLLAISALLLRELTRNLAGSVRAGDLAALGMLLYPTLAAFSNFLWPAIGHIALWLAVLWILASGRRDATWLAFAGTLMGLAILTRHLLLVFVPIVALVLWLDTLPGRRRSVTWFLIPVVLVVTPVAWLDWSEDGRLRSASNVRFNLWVGLNDQARRSFDRPIVFREYLAYLDSADDPVERDRILAEKTATLIEQSGLFAVARSQLGKQLFRLFDSHTTFTEQLPGGSLHGRRRGYALPPGRVPTFLRALDRLIYAAILVAAVWGLVFSLPSESKWLRLILVFIGYNLAIFLVLHVKSRYRLQMMPFLILFAGIAIDRWLQRGDGPGPRARTIGWAGSLALLALAFGGPFLE